MSVPHMIGMLQGTVTIKNDPFAVVSVHGVGYKVFVPQALLSRKNMGDEVTLFVHTLVREDALELYGFESQEDLRLFEYFLGVSGVGGKTALGIFSAGDRSQIVSAIASGDVQFFSSVPRLGKKSAQKIIIELKSKIGSTEDLDLSEAASENDEVVLALKSFGFSANEAVDAVRAVKKDGQSSSEQIRLALKYLGR